MSTNQKYSIITGQSNGVEKNVSGKIIHIRKTSQSFKDLNNKIAVIFNESHGGDSLFIVHRCIKAGAKGIVLESTRCDHGIIASKELAIPTLIISDINQLINHQGIYTLSKDSLFPGEQLINISPSEKLPPYKKTNHPVKINIGFPLTLTQNPRLINISDGVGFCRLEFTLLEVLNNTHPKKYLQNHTSLQLAEDLAKILEPMLKLSKKKAVWFRTDDFSADQLYFMDGGAEFEIEESNGALGWRGIRRSLEEVEFLICQFQAFKILQDKGYKNIGIFPPMTISIDEYEKWLSLALSQGLLLSRVKFGLMVETPAAALTITDFLNKISFIVFGTNDLTQFTLGTDRSNPKLSKLFNEKNPAVLKLLRYVIKKCQKRDIETFIGGQAGSDTELLRILFNYGLTGTSLNADLKTIANTRHFIYNYENEQLLNR